mmetsp:Transcript_26784/g.59158  ORF Transcript_26784/g.59158 Transcript_26784/m.59158 type:complete len:240 (-) Transcript_26784:106-825(-)
MAAGSGQEQFLILARNAHGKACEALVQQVLDSKTVFHFGELLDVPSIAELASAPQSQGHHELLRLFAYGTYSEYQARAAALPPLSAAALGKLRILTVVSLACLSKVVEYPAAMAAVGLESVREVEELFTEAIYAGLVKGKMNQQHQCLEVESCVSRDIKPGDLDYILATLTNWRDSSSDALQTLQNGIGLAHSENARYDAEKVAFDELVKQKKEAMRARDTEDPARAGKQPSYAAPLRR